MKVEKRNGRIEDFDIEKIHDVLFWATENIKGVSVSDIEIKIADQFQIIKTIALDSWHQVNDTLDSIPNQLRKS